MIKTLILCVLMLICANAVAQTTYAIQPGDRLTVTVVEDNTLNTTALVGPDGTIAVPAAGSVRVAGLTTTAVERVLRNRLAGQFQLPPTVSVGLAALGNPALLQTTLNVYVLGEVGNSGQLQVERGTTILQALALAGGTTQFAADKRIQLRRVNTDTGRDSVLLFNYRAVQQGAQINRNVELREGDVIVVPERRLFE